MAEQDVRAAAAGYRTHGRGELVPELVERVEAIARAVPVNVEHDRPRDRAGRHADVRGRPRRPPPLDLVAVAGRVLEPVLSQRHLAAGLDRKDGEAALGEPERVLEQLGHRLKTASGSSDRWLPSPVRIRSAVTLVMRWRSPRRHSRLLLVALVELAGELLALEPVHEPRRV